jgi:hypothetical protein
MDVATSVGGLDVERTLFLVGAVLSGALTALLAYVGAGSWRLVLFLSFSLYLLGAAIPAVDERVPEYKRKGAIALGGIGALAAIAGTPSALPFLFVLAGIAALLGLF